MIHKEKNEKNFEKKKLSNTCQNTENFINIDYKYYQEIRNVFLANFE